MRCYSKAADPVAEAAHLAADGVRYDNGRNKNSGRSEMRAMEPGRQGIE